MDSVIRRFIRVLILSVVLAATAWAFPAQAGYRYTSIDYPGAPCTVGFGLDNSGNVVGEAAFATDCSGTSFSFIYDSRNRRFTPLPTVPSAVVTSAIGLNEKGVIVGSAGDGTASSDVGFSLDKGAFSFFVHPGAVYTQGRAINIRGVITGTYVGASGLFTPFIYDPNRNEFIDVTFPGITPQPFFLTAQGITSTGEVVGNFRLDANAAFAGSPAGHYGFLRDRNGAITLFRVNDANTRGRGINEHGQIAGYFDDTTDGMTKGYVTRLGKGQGFQALELRPQDIVNFPGSTFTVVAGINESGAVSGEWIDAAGLIHGFIAKPE
jgi:uncharacterized membrane protein